MFVAKYAYVHVLLQFAFVKSYGVSNSPILESKKLRITVSVFLFTSEHRFTSEKLPPPPP